MARILNKKNLLPGVVPSLGELDLGELAINTFDGKLYTKRDQGGIHTIVEIGNGPDATGLKSVDQGNGIGWALQCRIDNPDHYGNLGHGAVDFSASASSEETGATGRHSFAVGYSTTAYGTGSHAEGKGTLASGKYSHTGGVLAEASGYASFAHGKYVVASGENQVVIGTYNFPRINSLFLIGNGYGGGSAGDENSNAFEVYIDGRVIAPSLTNALINTNRSLVTKEYVDALGVGGASELEKITEGSKTGWRLLGVNPDNYGIIGNRAVDLSQSWAEGNNGATGYASFAIGTNTSAFGYNSYAEGYFTISGGGTATHAEGAYSFTALGSKRKLIAMIDNFTFTLDGTLSLNPGVSYIIYNSESHFSKLVVVASQVGNDVTFVEELNSSYVDWIIADRQTRPPFAQTAHAEGSFCAALSENTHAEGTFTTAKGYASHAEGGGTIAQNNYMHAAGSYNTGTSTETIHETGIGGYTTRKNAFEIYTNGRIIAPELTAGLIANDEQTLTTRKYVDDAVSGVSIHTHDNKTVIDGISEADVGGTMVLAYNGNAVDHVVAQRDVYDDLDSIDPTISLSANQGRILNNRITEAVNDIVLQDQDFDGTVGDNEFIITGEVLQGAFVYKEGLKLRSNQFSVTNDGTDTTITLMQALNSNAWIAVEFTR